MPPGWLGHPHIGLDASWIPPPGPGRNLCPRHSSLGMQPGALPFPRKPHTGLYVSTLGVPTPYTMNSLKAGTWTHLQSQRLAPTGVTQGLGCVCVCVCVCVCSQNLL